MTFCLHDIGKLLNLPWVPKPAAVPTDTIHGFQCGWETATADTIYGERESWLRTTLHLEGYKSDAFRSRCSLIESNVTSLEWVEMGLWITLGRLPWLFNLFFLHGLGLFEISTGGGGLGLLVETTWMDESFFSPISPFSAFERGLFSALEGVRPELFWFLSPSTRATFFKLRFS